MIKAVYAKFFPDLGGNLVRKALARHKGRERELLVDLAPQALARGVDASEFANFINAAHREAARS